MTRDGMRRLATANGQYIRLIVYGAVLLSFFVLIFAFVDRGVPAAHDTAAHFTYIYLFDQALQQGQVPVRWVEWVRSGHGQPLFNYYQPGLYYLTELTHLVVPSLTQSLELTVLCAWWMGSGFVYLLLRPLGPVPAAVGAIGFAFSPYLALDLFVRGAYPEFTAIALAPGVLWAIDRSLTHGRARDRLAFALLLALMALCHLPSLLIFAPVFASYGTYTAVVQRTRSRQVAALLGAGVLAFGMCAFYVVPAIAEIDHIRMKELTTEYFDFHRHFVMPRQWFDYEWQLGGSVDGPNDQMSFQVGQVQWLIVVLTLVRLTADAFRRRRGQDGGDTNSEQHGRDGRDTGPRRSGLLVLWLGVIAAALFLMTEASVRVWDTIPALAYVQFPWRLLMVISVACSMLAALLLAGVRDRRRQALIALAAIALQVSLVYDHLKPSGYIPRAQLDIDRPGWRYSQTVPSAAFIEAGYHPIAVRQLPSTPRGRWTIAEGEGRVRAISLRDHALALEVQAPRGLRLSINTPYFPGWVVQIDGNPVPVSRHPDLGYMELSIPPGTHRIDASFTDTPIRHWSNIVSAISLGTWLLLLAGQRVFKYSISASFSSRDRFVP